MPELAVAVSYLRVVEPDDVPPEVAKARAERSVRRVQRALMASSAALTVLGLLMVLSASSVSAFAQYGSSFLFFKRQLLYAVIGSVAALLASRVRYRAWQRAWLPVFALAVFLLVMVLHSSAGVVAGGAARWISVAGFSLQPSEIAKFAVIAATAAILSRNMKHLDEPIRWVVPIVLVVGTVTGLIVFQPDLGTAMVIALSVLVLLFVAGVRMRFLITTILFGGSIGMALIMGRGYSHSRFLCFLHPWANAQNCGYQIIQSLVALGSGHVFGVGLGASRQKWMYVPNAHTDFIFSIMGEELGLMGELVVLTLFGIVIYAGIRIAIKAPDAFGRLLAAGITAWLGLQALINLGAVTGMLPITGVPLPFLSFGGSSLVMSLIGVGVLLSVGRAELDAVQRKPGRRPGRPARPREARTDRRRTGA
jgi:cell division protein FtsW